VTSIIHEFFKNAYINDMDSTGKDHLYHWGNNHPAFTANRFLAHWLRSVHFIFCSEKNSKYVAIQIKQATIRTTSS